MLKFRNANKLLLVTSDCLVEVSESTLNVCVNGSSIISKIPDEVRSKMTPKRIKLFKNYVYDVVCNPERTIRLPMILPPDYSDYINLDILAENAYVFSKALLHKELYDKLEHHLLERGLSYPFSYEKTGRQVNLFNIAIEKQLSKDSLVKGTIDGIPFIIDWIPSELRVLSTDEYMSYSNAMNFFPKEL